MTTRKAGDTKMTNIASKILRVRDSVGVVGKGKDANQNFKYQKWDDVFPAVWDACEKHSVVISQTIDEVTYHQANDTGRGVPQKRVEVRVTFRLIDAESGESIEAKWAGEAVGSDDKILQKAITSATKYFFLKSFGIPFEDTGHDTDGDSPDVGGKRKAPEFDPKTYQAKLAFSHTDKENLRSIYGTNARIIEVLREAWDNNVETRDQFFDFIETKAPVNELPMEEVSA